MMPRALGQIEDVQVLKSTNDVFVRTWVFQNLKKQEYNNRGEVLEKPMREARGG